MPSIHEVKGVGPTMAAALGEKGILTPEQLASIKMDDLLMVSGVGPSRAQMLIDAAKEAVGTSSSTPDAVTLVNSEPIDDGRADPEESEDDPVTSASEKTEQVSQVATKQTKTGTSVISKPSGDNKAKSKKSEKAKKAKKTRGDPAIRALKKEVKKRKAALKRQKAKLKHAKKALRKLA